MPDSIAEALADDTFIGPQREPAVDIPSVDDKDVWLELLRQRPADEWQQIIDAARSVNPDDWSLDLSGVNLYEVNLNYRDLSGIDFRGARLEYCQFRYADMSNTKFDSSSFVYGSNFSRTKLTGSNIRNATGIEAASYLEQAYGYIPPLQDVTQEVARQYLMEAIADPTSFIHEGLDELRADGFKLFWVDDKLKFYLNYEMQRYRDLCKEGACDCPTEHECCGDCTCCACYRGSCDCTQDHEYGENQPTDEYYLATVVGHVGFRWNSSLGFIGDIVMDRCSRHPHVSTSGNICWGDAEMPRSIRPIDYFIAMMGWVGQHNPSDPYREITTDLPRIR